ncbi:MAG: PDZ domain-containing protein [Vicinamibacteria bacterium]
MKKPRLIALMALVSISILAFGVSVRRAFDTGKPATPAPSESDLLRLARLSQRRTLDDSAAYLASIGDQAQRSLIAAGPRGGTAVVWRDGLALTTERPRAIGSGAPPFDLGPISVRAPEVTGLTPVVARLTPMSPGEWIVVAWRLGDVRAHATGSVSGTRSIQCGRNPVTTLLTTVAFPPDMAGAGVFDLDGYLAAMVVKCDDTWTAVVASDLDALREMASSVPQRVTATFGMRLTDLTPNEAAYFKVTNGLVVREIWEGSPSGESSLRPGDLLRMIDGDEVLTLEAANARLLQATASVLITAERGRSRVVASLKKAEAPSPSGAGVGIEWNVPHHGYLIDAVDPLGPAGRAGVRAGDRALRVDGTQPRTLADLTRRLAAAGPEAPVLLELEREARRFFLILS